jgi:membrane-anchored protein YejM (alkaline phosphatase superfamily)
MDSPDPWFRARRFGYGAGLPIRWQGWAVLASYLALVLGSRWLLTTGWHLALTMAASLVLVVVALRHTERR